ncbi:MAG: CpsD/CapB family tyrosine-protein kinase [Eubacteriaceae bacterium]|nr:CpsD/CapB family tyrosine-protein kinase [Eubacteriaceae bacterium]
MKNIIAFQTDPKSSVAEAFRNLRTNVSYTNVDREVKVIQMTSSVQGEGKSIITANYGATVAQSDRLVLIVDCDLRRPRMHKIFNVPNELGLSNALVSDYKNTDLIKETEIGGLFVITSGPIPPNPSEMLDSHRMKKLISSLRTEFDMILLDSPPILPITDGLVLSQVADGTIVVISLGTTEKGSLKRTFDSLENIGAHILGTIINKVNYEENYYTSYGYK